MKLIKHYWIIILVLFFSLVVALSIPFVKGRQVTVPLKVSVTTTFSYKGEAGKDALTILKEKTPVKQDKSGLVVSIDNRQADSKKHEYWAFYVNGKYASVGPADYQTKATDKIDWKIEKY